jgi:hypothetical protein
MMIMTNQRLKWKISRTRIGTSPIRLILRVMGVGEVEMRKSIPECGGV